MKNSIFYLFIFYTVALNGCIHPAKQEKEEIQKFCVSDTLMKDIVIEEATIQEVMNELVLSGKITSNEDKVVKVYPLVGGNVVDVKVELGDYVEKDQVLAIIRSSEIADFENQLISAQSNVIIAQKNLDVAEDLYQTGLVSEKDLITAKKELQKAEGELKKVKEILYIYGVDNNSFYTVKAPISGFIVEKNVTENMQFRTENTSNLFTVSNLDEVWVVANVYETDINKIKVGYDVVSKILPYPEKEFPGKIDKIFNVLDPETRVMRARVKLINKDYLLKPEMYAQINIKYKKGDEKKVAIPASSVIFDKNRHFVLVFNNQCDLQVKEVEVASSVNGITYIDSGIDAGEKVVSKYQLMIYQAMND
ncbi:MAG: efflux RND transporter periplasmic adaptor subunit [Cytophagaceae bacterium]